MTKKIEQIYRKLSEVEHVLARTQRYLGSIAPKEVETYVIENGLAVWKTITYNPAFLKIFDEIITNSADFSKTDEGKHLNKIDVVIDKENGSISVTDNGGIPVVKHTEYDQYVPDMIFGELRSGSNFDDDLDSSGAGQNGEGSTLTNIMSKSFTVDTADGKNRFLCTYYDNMSHKDKPSISKCKKAYTTVTYTPDYDKFKMVLDADNIAMLERRVYEIAGSNTHIQVSLNGAPLKFKSFKQFAEMFATDRIDFGNAAFECSVAISNNGFKHITFVNSTNVSQGGTHVDYIMNQVVNGIRDHIKKKTKQEVKPAEIKNHFFLIMNTKINKPRYDSQTKENLVNAPKDFGYSYVLDEKTIKLILKSNIVAEILLWAENKKKMQEMRDLNEKNKELDKDKKTSLKHITKYESATSKIRSRCTLFLAEGDSAAKALQSARNPEIHGILPLKGKPINTREKKLVKLIENTELTSMMQIIGLQFGVEPVVANLRYHRVMIAPDQDYDGSHVCGLSINLFYCLWPSLFKQDFFYKLETPIVRVMQGKKELEFMSLKSFEAWKIKQTKPFVPTYLKGLGSSDTKYFKNYMSDEQYHIPLIIKDAEDIRALEIAFDKKLADERKVYIYGA